MKNPQEESLLYCEMKGTMPQVALSRIHTVQLLDGIARQDQSGHTFRNRFQQHGIGTQYNKAGSADGGGIERYAKHSVQRIHCVRGANKSIRLTRALGGPGWNEIQRSFPVKCI